jgi:hypothetical protein
VDADVNSEDFADHIPSSLHAVSPVCSGVRAGGHSCSGSSQLGY